VSERVPPSRSTRAGRRGRHKHHGSAETQRWNREFLPTNTGASNVQSGQNTQLRAKAGNGAQSAQNAQPRERVKRPSWMSADTYRQLAELREQL
jgi:hypothetical protein